VTTDGQPPHLPGAAPRRGGRPSRQRAGEIQDEILDVATELLLTEGYGATSIEAVAKRARISKRTFYHRFQNKAELFGAVVHRLVERLRPPNDGQLFEGGAFEDILERIALVVVHAALSPQVLALQRVIIAEATRFPELAAVLNEQGTRREAIDRVAAVLERQARAEQITLESSQFAAEEFLQMVVSGPQRRAFGLGTPLSHDELDRWARAAVKLFLNGWRGNARTHAEI
jgi:TetR/AcrR family transcriptional regulator, mexJK operon transcriptional repressor